MPLSARRSDAFCTLLLSVTLRLGKGSVTPMVLAAHPPVMCRRCSPGFSNLAVKHDQVVFNREGFPQSGAHGIGDLRTQRRRRIPPHICPWHRPAAGALLVATFWPQAKAQGHAWLSALGCRGEVSLSPPLSPETPTRAGTPKPAASPWIRRPSSKLPECG